jgi:hypothetical protein
VHYYELYTLDQTYFIVKGFYGITDLQTLLKTLRLKEMEV